MNDMERRNKQAELEAAVANERHCLETSEEVKPHHKHLFLIKAELWNMYAEQLRIELDHA